MTHLPVSARSSTCPTSVDRRRGVGVRRRTVSGLLLAWSLWGGAVRAAPAVDPAPPVDATALDAAENPTGARTNAGRPGEPVGKTGPKRLGSDDRPRFETPRRAETASEAPKAAEAAPEAPKTAETTPEAKPPVKKKDAGRADSRRGPTVRPSSRPVAAPADSRGALKRLESLRPEEFSIPPSVTPNAMCDELRRALNERRADEARFEESRKDVERREELLKKREEDIKKAWEQLKAEREHLEALLAGKVPPQAPGAPTASATPDGKPAPTQGRPSSAAARGVGMVVASGSSAPSVSQIDQVAKSLRGVKPEQAAKVVQKLDPSLAALVIMRMRPADSAKLLEKLPEELAADLLTEAVSQPPAVPETRK